MWDQFACSICRSVDQVSVMTLDVSERHMATYTVCDRCGIKEIWSVGTGQVNKSPDEQERLWDILSRFTPLYADS